MEDVVGKRAKEKWQSENAPPPMGHNAPTRHIKLAIVRSRTFENYRLREKKLSEYVDSVLKIISGGADGADSLGTRWGRKNVFVPPIYEPDHKKYKHAYHHRNRMIAEACTLLIAFWGGRSTGTKYTIDYAKRIARGQGRQVLILLQDISVRRASWGLL
jgi:predicted Rossmann fold nucleotide-binding protein DprA/Smf involved in DNA uptake